MTDPDCRCDDDLTRVLLGYADRMWSYYEALPDREAAGGLGLLDDAVEISTMGRALLAEGVRLTDELERGGQLDALIAEAARPASLTTLVRDVRARWTAALGTEVPRWLVYLIAELRRAVPASEALAADRWGAHPSRVSSPALDGVDHLLGRRQGWSTITAPQVIARRPADLIRVALRQADEQLHRHVRIVEEGGPARARGAAVAILIVALVAFVLGAALYLGGKCHDEVERAKNGGVCGLSFVLLALSVLGLLVFVGSTGRKGQVSFDKDGRPSVTYPV